MGPKTPLDAYWNFFESFNSRDPHRFSAALHYPHLRVSWRQDARVVADAEAHALAQSWNEIKASGWERSIGAEPHVIQSSEDKFHIAGGWTRVDKDNHPILSNRVVYIVTRIDGYWGIQSRFGTDPGGTNEDVETDNAIMRTIGWMYAHITQNKEDALRACSAPYFEIEVGGIRKVANIDQLTLRNLSEPKIERVQNGPGSVTYKVYSQADAALVYVTNRRGWRIEAISWL